MKVSSKDFMVLDNFELECIQVLDNIEQILKSSGSSMKDIIKLTVYLTDLSNFDIFEIHGLFENVPLPIQLVGIYVIAVIIINVFIYKW